MPPTKMGPNNPEINVGMDLYSLKLNGLEAWFSKETGDVSREINVDLDSILTLLSLGIKHWI